MNRVFLSYSSSDSMLVTFIYRELSRSDLEVWIDEKELGIGEALTDALSEAIEEVDYFLIVISSVALRSRWVKKELKIAVSAEKRRRRKLVIPILIENVKLPVSLRNRTYCDLTKNRDVEKEFKKLVINLGGRFLDDKENSNHLEIIPSINEMRGAMNELSPSRIDILLINGGNTIHRLVFPYLQQLDLENSNLTIRCVFLNSDSLNLTKKPASDAGAPTNYSARRRTVRKRLYEALIVKSRCIELYGDHCDQLLTSIKMLRELKESFPSISVRVRLNSRLPFCKILTFDDYIFYTPYLYPFGIEFYSIKIAKGHSLHRFCDEHFNYMFESGNEVDINNPNLLSCSSKG
ncbi:MAG: toll/interleukin-1 receptor domain-containing protein [Planctomycetota bacterium]|nr:toll/interleukin-1 receptor domain-containing protein [Planctomycetota bacterium]